MKTIPVLLLAGLAYSPFAAKLTVAESPSSTQYASITAALSDADAGDTILITSKSTGDWQESVTIDKRVMITKSADIDSTAQITGTWTVTASDTVVLNDLDIDGSLTYTSGSSTGVLLVSNCVVSGTVSTSGSNGGLLRILGSSVQKVSAGAYYTLEALSNKVSGAMSFCRGDVIGNTFAYTTATLTVPNSSGVTDDTVQIIGNYFNGHLKWSSAQVSALIANNYFDNDSQTDTSIYIAGGASGKLIRVSHNNIYSYYKVSTYGICSDDPAGTVMIDHNYVHGYSSSDSYVFAWKLVGTSAYLSVIYNTANSVYSVTGSTNADDYTGNKVSSSNTYTLTNAGSSDPVYNNVDGTQSTIGYEGGAHPYSLYHVNPGWVVESSRTPRVFEVSAPLKVTNGESFTLKARAFDR